jgi:glycosyltransferase involved in cell wall biosynthesis
MVEVMLYVLYAVLAVMFFIGVWRLRFALTHFKMKRLESDAGMVDNLPSVTVCIPARNEDHAMTECLQRVIASHYPKLEIIVLDDMSGDNTSVLIKSFAHEGVRFVEGASLPKDWLGKNHALQELLDEASGNYVLFMDVDTMIGPDSIEELVAYARQEKAAMVSVLPRREDGPRASVIFSTLRYFWEVMFHHKASPATASNAWLIERKVLLDKWNGFHTFKTAIQPESRFSAALMAEGSYRFLIGTEQLGIAYQKKWRSQIATSIRLLFPLLGAKTAHMVVAVLDLLIIASPLFIVLSGFIAGWGVQQVIAGVFMVLFAGLYGVYLQHVWKKGWLFGAIFWPYIVLQEATVILLSARQYAKKAVTWKGRLVKVPK